MSKSPSPARKLKAGSADASPAASPKGSRKDLAVGSPKGSKKDLLEHKTSPLVTHKAAVQANPAGSLQKESTLKSWEVRGLKEIVWKHAHSKVWPFPFLCLPFRQGLE